MIKEWQWIIVLNLCAMGLGFEPQKSLWLSWGEQPASNSPVLHLKRHWLLLVSITPGSEKPMPGYEAG